ncbi:MAG: phage portal protein [Prevotellaceae bacterium]|jgi:SPP1 family phage portal protein|nr:phage portal protein [Prevotellaceae bacterium]
MADIKEIFKGDDATVIISELKKGRQAAEPNIELYVSQINPYKHNVFDKEKRPDKKVRVSNPQSDKKALQVTKSDSSNEGSFKYVPVARVALAIQKLIVKRAVAFTFGNPVMLNCEPKNDAEAAVLKAVNAVLFDTKARSLNRQIAREIFSATETAELWYPVEKPANYGFQSKFKLRTAIFSVEKGDKLFPYFDPTGDMVAFSREYQIEDQTKNKKRYFETYTDTEHYIWVYGGDNWTLLDGYPKNNAIGKIPVIYGAQPNVEWADVQVLIERLETLLSNFSDTNDYHAAPKIIVKGKIKGFAEKGETGAILQLEGDNPDARYLEWSQAPESVRLEIDTLLRMIYTITQTPDISFDTVKGIGAVSGIALKLLFMDAHLKVQEKMEIFDDYLQRRISIIKSFLAQMNVADKNFVSACNSLIIEPEIKPFMIEDENAKIQLLISANGGKAIISQKTSIQQAGVVNDADKEFKQIQKESQSRQSNAQNQTK